MNAPRTRISAATIYKSVYTIYTCLYLFCRPVYFTFLIHVGNVQERDGFETESIYLVNQNSNSVRHLILADTQIFIGSVVALKG